jgi:hypothetical protein
MRWSELDLENKVWSLPRERCNNGHAHGSGESGLVFGVSSYSYSTEKRDALDLWAEHVERVAGNFIVRGRSRRR